MVVFLVLRYEVQLYSYKLTMLLGLFCLSPSQSAWTKKEKGTKIHNDTPVQIYPVHSPQFVFLYKNHCLPTSGLTTVTHSSVFRRRWQPSCIKWHRNIAVWTHALLMNKWNVNAVKKKIHILFHKPQNALINMFYIDNKSDEWMVSNWLIKTTDTFPPALYFNAAF